MQNVMEAVIVDHPLGLPPSLRDDDHVLIVMRSIGHWLAEMAKRPKPQRFLCLDCDTTFHARRMPEAFGMAVPLMADKGRQAWTTGIAAAARKRIALYYCKNWWSTCGRTIRT
jgi:hypothetical protein